MQVSRRWCPQGRAVAVGLMTLTGMIAAENPAGSVPQRPNAGDTPTAGQAVRIGRATSSPVFALDVGLAGPPLVGKDGTWWVSGRDGQLVNLAADDTVKWAIGVGAAITGEATSGDSGIVFVPTANELIVAVQPNGTPRWRSRTARGVDGPLAWVAGQGLVFVGRDQNVCWLGLNAALLQTQRLVARRSAGPKALGTGFAVGTETGELLVWWSRNTPARLKLAPPIRSIIAVPQSEYLVLAGTDAYGVTNRGQVRWQRSGVVALGHTVALDRASRASVIVTNTGHVEWLGGQGEVAASMDGCTNPDAESVPELVATNECAWISSASGTLLRCCPRGGVDRLELSRAPLQRPVVDTVHNRVLVGSSEREVWSVPLTASPGGL